MPVKNTMDIEGIIFRFMPESRRVKVGAMLVPMSETLFENVSKTFRVNQFVKVGLRNGQAISFVLKEDRSTHVTH